ncbi:MAG TPA: gamma-glutamyl-gamma-aminobutyrate hydrolase family protein [Acidimicrobiales bacterium]|jgi:putative glutamine amidotransferase|nr:gamma-glutamyl-gamma-aminobutyrate hydrolase family protein [Acidimicrobiales bacterium]
MSAPFSSDEVRFIAISAGRIAANGRVIDGTQRDYGDRVAEAGGVPFLLIGRAGSSAMLSRADGLLFTGGGDVEPARYGAAQSPETGGVDVDRDRAEVELVAEAVATGIPVLAVCRGIQIVNVARGGTLIQDLPAVTAQPHLVIDRPHDLVHAVRVDPDSELRDILGADEVRVNSLHHQAVDTVGEDLRAVAWAEDGTIEAVEDRRSRIIGVQWHPEQLADQAQQRRLFSWLVDQSHLRLTAQSQTR